MSNPIKAALSVTGATGAIIANKGFSGVVHSGAGIWVCTLAAGVAAASCAATVSRRSAAAAADGTFAIAHTSATDKEVTYTVGGVATDIDFDLILVDLTAAG